MIQRAIRLIVLASGLVAPTAMCAQHDTTGGLWHEVSAVISHTHVSQGIGADGDTKWLALPSWAVNYNLRMGSRWSVGVHCDLIVEDFVVEEHLGRSEATNTLERSYPLALAVMGGYRPGGKHLAILLGGGMEFAHTGDLSLVRLGLERAWHLGDHWELVAVITDDLKFNAYNSWALGMGVARSFGH
jgi:hypothetical protein